MVSYLQRFKQGMRDRARKRGSAAGRVLRRVPPLAAALGGSIAYSSTANNARARGIIKRMRNPKYVSDRKVMKRLGITSGRQAYKGKFAGSFRKSRKLRSNPYLSKGFQHTIEVNGQVSDPDCVYVGHCTHVGTLMVEIMCQALLRKLLQKAGMNITSITQKIQSTMSIPGAQYTGDALRFVVTRQNKENGLVEAFLYDTLAIADISIASLTGSVATGTVGLWETFANVLKEYASGAAGISASNVKVPFKLQLYYSDKVGVSPTISNFEYKLVSELQLANEIIHYGTTSTLKIQNRTVSADGSNSTDNVSNNPIDGRMYKFSNGVPYARVEDVQKLEIMAPTTGAITVRAAEFTGSALGLTEPPPAQIFSNCVGTSKVGLQPGNIKVDKMSYKTSQNFLEFLCSFGFGLGALGAMKKIRGKSTLFAFEDVINVNVTYNIVIAYEINRLYGCYFTTMRASPALGSRFQMTQNSLPT